MLAVKRFQKSSFSKSFLLHYFLQFQGPLQPPPNMAPDRSILLSNSILQLQLYFVALTDGCLELQLRGKRDNVGFLNQLYEEVSRKRVSFDDQTFSANLRGFSSCRYFKI